MSDATTHLLLPYILAAQAQKHVTHNEALRLLDGLVQLSVLDRDLAAPPANPADGDRYLVASGATGVWSGWDFNVAYWVDGAWMKLVPRAGWRMWVEDEGLLLVYDGVGWVSATPASGTFAELNVASGFLSVSSLSCDWGAFSLTGATSGKDIRPGQNHTMRSSRSEAGNAFHHLFYDASGGIAGAIRTDGAGATTFNTTSDERLKSDRQDFDPGPILDAIPVHDFVLFGRRRRGFSSAQAMHAVFPEAVTPGTGDPGDPDFVPWSLDPSTVVPLLVREVQLLRARVADLEARGTATP